MRLVTHVPDGEERPGALVPDGARERLLDLTPVLGPGVTVTDVLADAALGARARAAVEGAVAAALPLADDARLAPPVRPRTILCLGYNYRGHVPDGEDPTAADPAFPDVFVKTPNTLSGPDDVVTLPPVADDVDYEGEIAVLIGARAHRVRPEDAMSHVAGYTLFDDVSDRAWQRRSSQWTLGKCFDGFGQLGPAVVTADEVPDFHDLVVEVEREGAVTVSQSTSTMVFRLPDLVAYVSQVMTLEPGDVISTGTPQKLPDALAAHRPLAHGDAVTIRVAGLGALTTRFAAAADAAQNEGENA
ncbi:fumarylacetoacetate hydrolase family protein [Cellulosimicrobium protaetiae]|uniref:Fumarylacetoacetate hydrolase family protein n=1 Tax=Cellulosimicrobium protaetiae TaxID=2587808 RepID=A0A6M5UEV1_9MICO|nr:fumarylacetoacetate hydrolase family protein [Cellulosimicrobium protaetiae]QJW36720.1 fumarylacetoacetate hydrolase family protein [Cellulosimicrobium protaetiae]